MLGVGVSKLRRQRLHNVPILVEGIQEGECRLVCLPRGDLIGDELFIIGRNYAPGVGKWFRIFWYRLPFTDVVMPYPCLIGDLHGEPSDLKLYKKIWGCVVGVRHYSPPFVKPSFTLRLAIWLTKAILRDLDTFTL